MFRIVTAMTDGAKLRPIVVAVLLAGLLAACATQGGNDDDAMGRFLVAADKFTLFNCAQLAEKAQVTAARENELLRLMAKAGSDTDGRLVSTIAYRPEYLELRGEMNELRRTAVAKNCKFVPGAEQPSGGLSNSAVR